MFIIGKKESAAKQKDRAGTDCRRLLFYDRPWHGRALTERADQLKTLTVKAGSPRTHATALQSWIWPKVTPPYT